MMQLPISRRCLLKGIAAASLLPSPILASGRQVRDFTLVAEPANVPLLGAQHPDTAVWAYNGVVPGPEIRVRQGDRIGSHREPAADDTTIHCHGMRLPNAMDGVPRSDTDAVAPGETFVYEFECPTPAPTGTTRISRSAEQVGRGLSGALIVEEREPIRVDRESPGCLSTGGCCTTLRSATISATCTT